METKQRINEDIKTAMKARENTTRDILRMIKSSITQVEVDTRKELDEKEVIDVITKYKKTVQDQIDEATKARRTDNLVVFENEMKVVLNYLPQQLTEEEIRNLVAGVIAEKGFGGKQDLGKVMGIVSPQTKGKADGKFVNQIVIELLG